MSAGVVERFDDSLNPIVVKELRQAVQSRFVVIALLLFLALQLLVLGMWILFRMERQPSDVMDFGGGREVFAVLHGIMLGTCMLFIPLYAGIRLAAERSDTNVDLLFVTALKPRAIIRGKLFAAVVLLLLIFSACAPFLAFTYLLRGIDIPTILIVLACDFLAVVAGTQLAMFVAVVPAPRVVKVLFGLAALGGLVMIFSGVIGATSMLVQFGVRVPLSSINFWGPAAVVAVLAVAAVGMVFTWSVAIVNPPSANRALPVRLYVLGVWLVAGAMFGYWAYYSGELEFFWPWIIGGVALFCLQFCISINEREQWAPRVARTIPRKALLQLPAFLLYSGSAGGVIFSVLGVAATLFIGHWAIVFFTTAHFTSTTTEQIIEVMTLLSLYVLAYGMTAVLVRNWVASTAIKPGHTWVLMAVLIALGSAIPYIIGFMIYYNDWRAAKEYHWLIANPFYAPFDRVDRDIYMTFTQIWAGVAVALNVPWFIRQLQRFRPYGA